MKKYLIYAMILTGGFLVTATQVSAQQTGSNKPMAAMKQVQYTCPMHPDVTSSQPGKCPECGMNLVEKTSEEKKTSMHGPEGNMDMGHQQSMMNDSNRVMNQHMMNDSTRYMHSQQQHMTMDSSRYMNMQQQHMMMDSSGQMHQGHMSQGSESHMYYQHMTNDSTGTMRHIDKDSSVMHPHHKKK